MMVNDGNTLRRCNAIHISSSCIKQICFSCVIDMISSVSNMLVHVIKSKTSFSDLHVTFDWIRITHYIHVCQ